MLRLKLLGTPQLQLDGVSVQLPTRKALLLLAYLGLEGAAPRRTLAALLWPDQEEAAALRNLRSELYRLGRCGVGPYLRAEGREIAPADDWQLDTETLPEHAEPLLAGLEVEEGPLAEWLYAARSRLAARARRELLERGRELEAAGDLAGARAVARTRSELDPADESAWLDRVRLSVLLAEPAEARAAYQEAEAALRRELDATPGAALRAWLEAAPRGRAPAQQAELKLPLLGRDALWKRLDHSEKPLLLTGEPGLGKSRLTQDFSAAHRPRLLVRGLPEARDWPLGALTRTVRAAASRGNLEQLPPELRERLRRLLPESDHAEAASAAPGSREGQRYLFESLADALALLLRRGTLVIDDLHDLDDLSLEALRVVLAHLARLPATERPRVILTARPPELAHNPAATALVEALEARGELVRAELSPLGQTELLSAVRLLARTEAGTRFAGRLYRATSGNPLFFLETWRHLHERGDLWADEEGQWHTSFDDTTRDYAELDLPRGVLEAVSARLLALGESARRVLEALCVAARPLDAETLEAVTGLDVWALAAAAHLAQQSGFLRVGSQYSLAHELHRRALLDQLTSIRRMVLHRELARALSARKAPALEVAEHLLAAQRPEEAARWLLRAADEATQLYALPQALEVLDRALARSELPELQAEVHRRAAGLHLALSETEAAAGHLDRLQGLAGRLQDESLAFETDALRAQLYYARNEYPAVLEVTGRLLDAHLPDALAARAHGWRGLALIRLGRFAEAQLELQTALTLGAAQRSHWTFQLHYGLLQIELMQGHYPEARQHADAAASAARLLGDPVLLAGAHQLESAVCLASGDAAGAEAPARAGLALARQIGQQSVTAQCSLNLGTSLYLRGRYAEARGLFAAVAERPELSPEVRAMARRNLGAVQLRLGELGPALQLIEDTLAGARERGTPATIAQRTLGLLEAQSRCGHPYEPSLWAQASATIEELDLGELRHYLYSLAVWRALMSGQESEAALDEALQTLAAQAPLPDETERHQLLRAEAHLRLRDVASALACLDAAPQGAWNTRLTLLHQAQSGHPHPATLDLARRQLRDPATTALDAAQLAAQLAGLSGQSADCEDAQNRAERLLASLNGRPEQASLARLLA